MFVHIMYILCYLGTTTLYILPTSCFVQSINNHNKAFIENVYLPPAIELLMLQKEKFQEHTTVYQTC